MKNNTPHEVVKEQEIPKTCLRAYTHRQIRTQTVELQSYLIRTASMVTWF
jgi:hypothetical protein